MSARARTLGAIAEAVAGKNEINGPLFDRFSLLHAGSGAVLRMAGAKFTTTLAVAIGWELLERPLKRRYPEAFPHATQDTVQNAVGDVFSMLLGWKIAERLTK